MERQAPLTRRTIHRKHLADDIELGGATAASSSAASSSAGGGAAGATDAGDHFTPAQAAALRAENELWRNILVRENSVRIEANKGDYPANLWTIVPFAMYQIEGDTEHLPKVPDEWRYRPQSAGLYSVNALLAIKLSGEISWGEVRLGLFRNGALYSYLDIQFPSATATKICLGGGDHVPNVCGNVWDVRLWHDGADPINASETDKWYGRFSMARLQNCYNETGYPAPETWTSLT
jgi:hypothetical protein